ncbi:outer membrane protein assembly factor BamC [Variovorax sp. HJSM1_2]|uniref:outer membrane protein assembly factor BamC n=1 Tax=Variovorax sp. HJSM1_2 TaxID=3366263 RepID=UPI003BC015E1
MKQFARLGLVGLAALALTACSVLEGEKIDYKSAAKGPTLDIPPDLSQLTRDTRYVVPGSPITASNYRIGQAAPKSPTAATAIGDVRIEREGTQRWLVIDRPADQLWGPVRDFWQESGFQLTQDSETLGIMETDWAENRAKLPQDFIRNSIGKVFDSLYSTGERDRFRTRLERRANGGTEIYVSHRGMIEVYNSAQKDQTVWQPRPADPELEAEFLRRLMVRLGSTPAQASAAVAGLPQTQATARVSTVGNQPVVQLDDNFDRAWRRVGLTLDRTGFTVEDRDRTQGLYFVRYVSPSDKKEPGFFANLFSSSKAVPPQKYRIAVRSQGTATMVSVLNAEGAADSSDNARRIVQVIADDLK